MNLGEVLKTYLSEDHQGQLVIKFIDEDHLCKIAVENGQAIYMTLGTKGPNEALDAIVDKVAEWSNFIKGMPSRKRLDEPLNQRLLAVAGLSAQSEEHAPLPATTEPQTEEVPALVTTSGPVESARIKITSDRFIDLIGPLGSILTERIFSDLAYTAGTQMNAATYTRFIAALADEVPAENRKAFIKAATL